VLKKGEKKTMKTVVIFLAVFYCCSFAYASDGEKDEGGQIRLCTCEEMDSCWKQMHEDMKPCTEKCKEKLTAPGLDSEDAKKNVLNINMMENQIVIKKCKQKCVQKMTILL
jgi:hypothetical protein